MRLILDHQSGGMGGLLGRVRGANGCYEVESIYDEFDDEGYPKPTCHLDFPSFETDVRFDDLTTSERQQIIDAAKKTLDELRKESA